VALVRREIRKILGRLSRFRAGAAEPTAREVRAGSGMLGTKWFVGMELNYARHFLRFER